MAKIINLLRKQRRKLHQMTLDNGERVMTCWIDDRLADKIQLIDDAVIYRLPSGQYFVNIDDLSRLNRAVANLSESPKDITHDNIIGSKHNLTGSVTRKNIDNRIDISNLL